MLIRWIDVTEAKDRLHSFLLWSQILVKKRPNKPFDSSTQEIRKRKIHKQKNRKKKLERKKFCRKKILKKFQNVPHYWKILCDFNQYIKTKYIRVINPNHDTWMMFIRWCFAYKPFIYHFPSPPSHRSQSKCIPLIVPKPVSS